MSATVLYVYDTCTSALLTCMYSTRTTVCLYVVMILLYMSVFLTVYLKQGGPPGLTWVNWINIKERVEFKASI